MLDKRERYGMALLMASHFLFEADKWAGKTEPSNSSILMTKMGVLLLVGARATESSSDTFHASDMALEGTRLFTERQCVQKTRSVQRTKNHGRSIDGDNAE